MTTQTEIFTIRLSSPLPYGDSTLTELKVRKPTASDLRGIKLVLLRETDAQILLDLIPRISLQPVTAQQLAAMSAVDTIEAMTVLAGFFLPSTTPSPTTSSVH